MRDWLKKMRNDKKEYKRMMARVDALPADYRYIYKKIQNYMWSLASGSGYDMLKVQYGLIELFEEGAANGLKAIEVTGEDVADFCDELLRNARTYTDDWRHKLNRDIKKKFGKGAEPAGDAKPGAGGGNRDDGTDGGESGQGGIAADDREVGKDR